MYRKRRESAEKQAKGRSDLSQFGIFGIPNVDDMEDGEEDDPELEAELMTILSSGSNNKNREKLKSSPKKAKGLPGSNLDQMIAESLRDVPSDESSGDEDDPSLLAELQAYTGGEVDSRPAPAPLLQESPSSSLVGVLKERISMYRTAEANAKSSGDTAKARRLGRGLKALDDLLRKAERGVTINEEEIPLPVTVTSPSHPPPKTDGASENEVEPTPPPVPPRRSVSETKPAEDPNKNVLAILRQRRDEYKKAAVVAKRAGDLEMAKAHVRVIKQFENVILGVERGENVDLSSMPAPPVIGESQSKGTEILPTRPAPMHPQSVPSISLSQPVPSVTPSEPVPPESPPQSAPPPEPQQENEVIMPASVLEALEQRLAVFKKQEETAKSEGNSSKARRMGRIGKQYEDAIRLHKAGKEIPVDDLPTPPGFPPIPIDKPAPKPEEDIGKQADQPPPVSPRQGNQLTPTPVVPQQPPPSPTVTPPKVSGRSTRQEKQLEVLLKRQKEWKEAAIVAKKAGDLAKAKDCLRQAKGFDALIDASRSGLPVDLTTIPLPPKEKIENDFEIVNATDCLPTGTNSEIFEQLKLDLRNQFKMSMETRLHYKTLGDVANANKFEQLAVQSKRDLDRVTVHHEKDDPVPRFHYEIRTFSIVRSNTDLNDNDLELSIIQGVNYNVPNPKEIDTYIRYEFPFPSEDPKKDKTSTVYNTNNPEYNTTVIIPIVRNSRACQRVFKRHSLKLEVWSKGGFLRSDTLIGTVNVKLQPLETKCTIHDSFNLMDGRKAVGGKLEIKIRLRHPIQQKEVEQVKERWLLID